MRYMSHQGKQAISSFRDYFCQSGYLQASAMPRLLLSHPFQFDERCSRHAHCDPHEWNDVPPLLEVKYMVYSNPLLYSSISQLVIHPRTATGFRTLYQHAIHIAVTLHTSLYIYHIHTIRKIPFYSLVRIRFPSTRDNNWGWTSLHHTVSLERSRFSFLSPFPMEYFYQQPLVHVLNVTVQCQW
jgi:hypothetical protein